MPKIPGGVLYEPRSLWSVLNVDTTPYAAWPADEAGPLAQIPASFDRENFRNGLRSPITITRIAILAMNYVYAQQPTNPTYYPAGASADQSAGALNRVSVRLGVPGRQLYAKYDVPLTTFRPKPTWGEPARADARANSFGVTRLTYDRPLYIPRTCALDIQLSSPSDFGFINPSVNNILSTHGVTKVPAEILSYEEGGLTPGSARTKAFQLNIAQSPLAKPNRQQGWPYPNPPGFKNPTLDNGVKFWDARHTFSASDWKKQEATRAGSSKNLALQVALNQTAYDAALIAQFGNTGRIAPLSTRIGMRVRSVDFGSGQDWWRPGCPLALCLDSITPATVYVLPQPVTLQPGDTFDVQAFVPGPNYGRGFSDSLGESDNNNASNYVLGISFNGYTTIEG